MSSWLCSVISVCFPFVEMWKKNKILKYNIENLDYDTLEKKYLNEVNCMEEVKEEELSALYEREFTKKDMFEDRAKTNVAAVTVFVTLIMGSYSLIDNIVKKYPSVVISVIASVFFALAVIYMFLAARNAFHIISEENVVHRKRIGLQEEQSISKEYVENICYNRMRNLIRNNYIATSYRCLRNALVCLLVVVMISIFPHSIILGDKIHSTDTSKNEIFYSAGCNNVLSEKNEMEYIESLILNKASSIRSNNENISFVDENKRLFIKMKIENGIINVYLIERYTK